ncbi:MAG: hypothetical protein K2F78_03780 [Muribaculaceae bacterium]|nr:hypothetical protein [Muribaculaceae bacterium]
MKKIALLLAVALSSAACFAQVNKSELKQLQNFLAQPAEKGGTNAEALKITNVKDPSTWEGVTVVGNNVTEIKWKDKKIAGTLDLSGFKALRTVDVSRNALSGVTFNGDPVLADVNVSRNKLTEVDLSDCPMLSKVAINNNRLTEFEISDVPAIKSLNIASNLLAELDLRASSTLETLNCQSNHLESLSVTDCTALKNLYAGYNKLTSLNLVGTTNLQNLNLDSNRMANMIVSNLPSLATFLCTCLLSPSDAADD